MVYEMKHRSGLRSIFVLLLFGPLVFFFPYGVFLLKDLLVAGNWIIPAAYGAYLIVAGCFAYRLLAPRWRRRRALLAKRVNRPRFDGGSHPRGD